MDTTIVLARALGPIILAMACMLILHKDVVKGLMSFVKNSPSYYLAWIGVGLIAISTPLLNYHHAWASISDIIVSLILWSIFIRGILLLLLPESIRVVTVLLDTNKVLLGFGTGIAVSAGIYLTVIGYFI